MRHAGNRLTGVVLLFALIVAGCSGTSATTTTAAEGAEPVEPDTIRFQASWIPTCQFAGYLMADEKGFYAENNLEVEVLPGGPNVNAGQQVVSGAAELTVNKVVGLYAARDEGLPLIAVAQFDRASSFPLVAYSDSGIETPEDLAGKEIGIWYDGDEYEVLALLDQAGLDPETDVTLFEQGFTMDPFLAHDYDVAMVTSFDELNVLRLEGIDPDTDLNIIDPSEYGISIPHGTLIANEDWLSANHDAAVRFVRATIEGWNYSFANKAETATVCAASSLAAGGEAATEDLEQLQQLMLDEMERLINVDISADQIGSIDPAMYQSVIDLLNQFEFLENEADLAASYDASIWEEATS